MVEININRNCNTCAKKNVCKYTDSVQEKINEWINYIEPANVPLAIDIKCLEYAADYTIRPSIR